MINMEPVLKRGYTFWDQSLLPIDEYTERVRAVQAAMAEEDLAAVLVFSNNYDNADLTYLTAGAGGTLFLPRKGDPSLFSGGGGRELPFQRMLTWIGDLSTAGSGIPNRVQQALKDRDIAGGRIGLVRGGLLSDSAYENLRQALPGFELQDFDAPMRLLRARKRPREVTAVRMAMRIAADAAEAAEKAFSEGASTTRAMLEAERLARLAPSRDFRILANIDSDDLRPFEGASDAARSPLLLWMALTYCCYWADLALTFPPAPPGEAAQAVDAMAAAARAGARVADVAAAGLSRLSTAAAETALAYGLGSGIGLALDEWPAIRPGSEDVLLDGALLSLRAFARDGERASFANAIVQVSGASSTRLTPL